MGSPTSPHSDVDRAVHKQLDIQRNWLHNVLPPSREICPLCRGARDPGFQRCYACNQAHQRSSGLLANAVVPISYSPDNGQHYHQLKVYKSPTSPNQLALLRLGVLYTEFVRIHRPCLERAAGGAFTHIATVPSTRQRPGPHPLQKITGLSRRLPHVTATPNPAHGNARDLLIDRFHVPSFAAGQSPVRILLVEDLWVTGARVQSLAHALRKAGADTVVAVTLGRHVNHTHPRSQPLLRAASHAPFDLQRCALDDLSG